MGDPAAAVDTHVADSLSGLVVEELRSASAIADLGAGAGFPGLPLAVALPGARVDLIESAGRKTAVSDRLAAAAEVSNARAITARAEDWARRPPPIGGRGAYDAVTARAVGALPVLLEYAAPLLREGGVLVAWRGARNSGDEGAARVAAVELGMSLVDVVEVKPFPAAEHRHLHVYVKEGPTPERFPRRTGVAAKRPLA